MGGGHTRVGRPVALEPGAHEWAPRMTTMKSES